MISFKELKSTLHSPGFVTSSPLTYNQLKRKLAKQLHITADDAIFEQHKESIKKSYTQCFLKLCRELSKSKVLRCAPRQRHVEKKDAKRRKSDVVCSEDVSGQTSTGSDSEDEVLDDRNRCISTAAALGRDSVMTAGRTTTAAGNPSSGLSQLTVAELKSILIGAGVKVDTFKRKFEYVTAAEALLPKGKDDDIGVIVISSSDDDQVAPAAFALANGSMVEISSSDDDKAPGFAVFGYGSGAVGGAAAVASDRRPTANGRVPSSGTIASTGALAFDPVCDASGTEIEMIENYRDSNDVLYGTIDIKTVGIQHYRGIIHVQETVFLVREPRNPYDANAIRVDNLSRVQIGHIAAKDGEHDAAPVN